MITNFEKSVVEIFVIGSCDSPVQTNEALPSFVIDVQSEHQASRHYRVNEHIQPIYEGGPRQQGPVLTHRIRYENDEYVEINVDAFESLKARVQCDSEGQHDYFEERGYKRFLPHVHGVLLAAVRQNLTKMSACMDTASFVSSATIHAQQTIELVLPPSQKIDFGNRNRVVIFRNLICNIIRKC